jgi:pyruvate,water dikinase
VALRERTKSLAVRQARLADYLAPEVARRLVGKGRIDREDDVFFLTHLEVSEALLGVVRRDFRALVARRRAERERARFLEYPERFRGRPVPRPPAPPADALVLHGTPVSAGHAVGRARVIMDPDRDGPLQPGEILVAPVTDAGWTPLFALAGGIVVDIGSALSHGSTVAREYGLPAVANVRIGTRSIRTGDLVEVDGRTGTVRILQRTEP